MPSQRKLPVSRPLFSESLRSANGAAKLDEGASESSWKMRLKDVYSGTENVELHPWLFIICLFHELLEVCGHPVGFLKSDEFCGPYSESVMFLNA